MILEDDKVQELVNALDLEQEAVYARYSGRCMYGDVCFGLVIDTPDVMVGVALAEVFPDDAWEIARKTRTDNMGYSTIVYWPGVQLAEDTRFAERYEEGDDE